MKTGSKTLATAGAGLIASVAFAASAFAAATPPGSVLAFDQKAGAETTVTYAFLPRDGYLVIYRGGDDTKPGTEIIGSYSLKAGDHRNVSVKLSEAVKPGERLWAKLHEDKDKDGKFNKASDPLKEYQVISPEQSFLIR